MPGKRNGLTGAVVAIALVATATRATIANQPAETLATAANPWLELTLLNGDDAGLVVVPCDAAQGTQAPATAQPPPPPPGQPPAAPASQPQPPPPTGCPPPPPPGTRRLGVYVGIAVAAAAGIGAAIALGGRRPNSAP